MTIFSDLQVVYYYNTVLYKWQYIFLFYYDKLSHVLRKTRNRKPFFAEKQYMFPKRLQKVVLPSTDFCNPECRRCVFAYRKRKQECLAASVCRKRKNGKTVLYQPKKYTKYQKNVAKSKKICYNMNCMLRKHGIKIPNGL